MLYRICWQQWVSLVYVYKVDKNAINAFGLNDNYKHICIDTPTHHHISILRYTSPTTRRKLYNTLWLILSIHSCLSAKVKYDEQHHFSFCLNLEAERRSCCNPPLLKVECTQQEYSALFRVIQKCNLWITWTFKNNIKR